MSNNPTEPTWDFGQDILATDRDETTNTITASLGDAMVGAVESTAEWVFPQGLIARPHKAQAGVANRTVQAATLRSRVRDLIFGVRDLVGQALAATLGPGETCLYAAGPDGTGQARVLLKGTGVVALYTAASAGATGMGLTVDPATDTITLLNAAGYGLIIDSAGVRAIAGAAAAVTVGSGGASSFITTGTMQIDGASGVLGSTVLPVVNAALTGPAGMVGKPSVKWLIE